MLEQQKKCLTIDVFLQQSRFPTAGGGLSKT